MPEGGSQRHDGGILDEVGQHVLGLLCFQLQVLVRLIRADGRSRAAKPGNPASRYAAAMLIVVFALNGTRARLSRTPADLLQLMTKRSFPLHRGARELAGPKAPESA